MLGKIAKVTFFLLAFLPIIVVAVLKFRFNSYILLGLEIFSIVLIFFADVFLNFERKKPSDKREFYSLEDKNSSLFNFIVLYLVVFAISFQNLTFFLIFAIAFVFCGIIYIKIGFALNPFFRLLWGYNIYGAKTGGKSFYLLSKNEVSEREKINVIQILKSVYIVL